MRIESRASRPWRPLWQENFVTMLPQIATDDDIMMRGKVVLRGTLPLCPLERCGGATNRKLGDDDDEAGNNDA